MSKYVIKGGNKIIGDVRISGAKNATLGVLAASIMADDDVIIENIPDVWDINMMIKSIEVLGAKVNRIDRNTVKINGSSIKTSDLINPELGKMRATYYFVGALLGKYKKAKIIYPGGCDIGERPVNLHLKGFKSLGAEACINGDYIETSAKELKGNNIYLDIVSVGATINIMLAAILADGVTTIENAAKEPHVVDIANFLNTIGANVKGAGTDTIKIKGVKKLHGATYTMIPDQIEAGTYMALATITKGDITIKNVIPKHLESISAKLVDIGSTVIHYDEAVRVISGESILPTNIMTSPYPGFPTDMQPQIVCTLCLANGTSQVIESIFEDRFKYINEIKKMGAVCSLKQNQLTIEGVEKLTPANITALDLRAGAALVLLCLATDGISVIDKIEYVERGYEDFVNKLTELGAKIIKVNDDQDINEIIKKF